MFLSFKINKNGKYYENFRIIAIIVLGELMENINILNYNYDAIKYFISVAKHGSLSRAASSLDISQSALSQSMKNLEQSLGVILFNRNTRGIILTEEGRVLYENATAGNEYFKNAIIETLRVRSFNNLKHCKISISFSLASLLISPIIRRLQDKLPNINLEFFKHIYENDVVDKLQSGEFDLVILKSNTDFNIKEVEVKKLRELHYVFAYSPDYFNLPEIMTMEELAKFPIIMKQRTGRNDNSWIKFSFDKFIECRNDNQCLELIKNGAGIGVYPKELVDKENLKVLNVEGFVPTKRAVFACFLASNEIAKKIVKEL